MHRATFWRFPILANGFRLLTVSFPDRLFPVRRFSVALPSLRLAWGPVLTHGPGRRIRFRLLSLPRWQRFPDLPRSPCSASVLPVLALQADFERGAKSLLGGWELGLNAAVFRSRRFWSRPCDVTYGICSQTCLYRYAFRRLSRDEALTGPQSDGFG